MGRGGRRVAGYGGGMSMRDNEGRVPYDKIEGVPGCGMAAYAGLLLLFLIAGVTGMVLATGQLLQAGSIEAPGKLRPGTQVAVRQLAPMRAAGVVAVDEVPLAWHDETPAQEGTKACALMADRLVRVDDEVGLTMAYADIDNLLYSGSPEEESSVTAAGTLSTGAAGSIQCRFGPHEGGSNLLKQLEVEQARAQE